MPEFLTLLPPDEARTLLLSHLPQPTTDRINRPNLIFESDSRPGHPRSSSSSRFSTYHRGRVRCPRAVALESKAAGSGTIACATTGVFTLTKKAARSTSWAQGGRVGYIVTGGVNALTGVLTSGKIIGTGWAAATTTATTGTIKLMGGASPTSGL